jgi:hypothetical protein
MDDPLVYLKAIIEGVPDIEPWKTWFEKNAPYLADRLTRTDYLDLKLNRIKAIPRILEKFGIEYIYSFKYDYLGGIAGKCRDCGAEVQYSRNFFLSGGFFWCPNGCFQGHAARRLSD